MTYPVLYEYVLRRRCSGIYKMSSYIESFVKVVDRFIELWGVHALLTNKLCSLFSLSIKDWLIVTDCIIGCFTYAHQHLFRLSYSLLWLRLRAGTEHGVPLPWSYQYLVYKLRTGCSGGWRWCVVFSSVLWHWWLSDMKVVWPVKRAASIKHRLKVVLIMTSQLLSVRLVSFHVVCHLCINVSVWCLFN